MTKFPCAGCTKKCLAVGDGCSIYRRRDGIYDVEIDETTHHMDASQFEAVARLFKLVLGISVFGESPSVVMKQTKETF